MTTDTHTTESAFHDDPAIGPTWFVAIAGVIMLVVVVLGVSVLYYEADLSEVEEKVIVKQPQEYQKLQQAQEQRLNTYGSHEYVLPDGETTEKRFHIPIDEAMNLVARQVAKQGESP